MECVVYVDPSLSEDPSPTAYYRPLCTFVFSPYLVASQTTKLRPIQTNISSSHTIQPSPPNDCKIYPPAIWTEIGQPGLIDCGSMCECRYPPPGSCLPPGSSCNCIGPACSGHPCFGPGGIFGFSRRYCTPSFPRQNRHGRTTIPSGTRGCQLPGSSTDYCTARPQLSVVLYFQQPQADRILCKNGH